MRGEIEGKARQKGKKRKSTGVPGKERYEKDDLLVTLTCTSRPRE